MIQLRPQPLGIFPFPASNLLLPAIEGDWQEALQGLLQGDLDVELPPQWEFMKWAAEEKIEKARAALAATDASEIKIYNQFVLSPSQEAWQSARQQLSASLRELLDVAAWSCGIADTMADSFALDGELLAVALATSAAAEIADQQPAAAMVKLKAAIQAARGPAPLLAATLISQLADLRLAMPECSAALVIQDYQQAIQLAANSRLPMLLAELQMKLGMVFQNAARGQRGALLQAINAYQSALQSGICEESQPQLFAQLQNNLGLAYLSMPAMGSSHQLRTGIAVQSFRHALRVFSLQKDPDMWASISMNLANALQYAPSSHPEENLIQAVETYEEVLQVRTRARDPVAYALVLLNQANALAHLGMFKPALEKLAEAYKLFHWYEQPEQAEAARQLVEQINERLGDRGQPVELTTQ